MVGFYILEDKELEETVEAAVGEEEEENTVQAKEETEEGEDAQYDFIRVKIIATHMDMTSATTMLVQYITLRRWETVTMQPLPPTKADLRKVVTWLFDMILKLM